MNKINIVYWSQTGNTQAMAEAIGVGVEAAGKEANVIFVGDIAVDDLKNDCVMALGCPAMGAEVLEEGEMEPFMCELESSLSGKTVALFGSYGWGDGEWMRDWVDRVRDNGANVLNGEGLICQETPDDDILEECRALGKQLAAQ